jgi:hypothetical protein
MVEIEIDHQLRRLPAPAQGDEYTGCRPHSTADYSVTIASGYVPSDPVASPNAFRKQQVFGRSSSAAMEVSRSPAE